MSCYVKMSVTQEEDCFSEDENLSASAALKSVGSRQTAQTLVATR